MYKKGGSFTFRFSVQEKKVEYIQKPLKIKSMKNGFKGDCF